MKDTSYLMPVIRFSEYYWKLAILGYPEFAILKEVREVNLEELSDEFKERDTRFFSYAAKPNADDFLIGHYPLPAKGKYLALGFMVENEEMGEVDENGIIKEEEDSRINAEINRWLVNMVDVFGKEAHHVSFCTLRSRYGKHGDKLEYYRTMIGKEFEIEVK